VKIRISRSTVQRRLNPGYIKSSGFAISQLSHGPITVRAQRCCVSKSRVRCAPNPDATLIIRSGGAQALRPPLSTRSLGIFSRRGAGTPGGTAARQGLERTPKGGLGARRIGECGGDAGGGGVPGGMAARRGWGCVAGGSLGAGQDDEARITREKGFGKVAMRDRSPNWPKQTGSTETR
jgi:hypothetical protein